LNVALSRAREKLVILANLTTYRGDERFNEILNRIQSLPHTCIEHVTADELDFTLPAYKRRDEATIIPDMSGVAEPEHDQPPAPIAPAGDYFDIA
jgi:hypothetical protein